MWREVEQKFNASSLNGLRKKEDLSKKWENLVSKQRAIYSDYIRDLNATGSGPSLSKYSLLTEAVIAVIGKETVSVRGVGGTTLDTTMNQLKKQNAGKDPLPEKSSGNSKRHLELTKPSCVNPELNKGAESTETRRCVTCWHCDEEVIELKKKKLRLEIALLERKLSLEAEQ